MEFTTARRAWAVVAVGLLGCLASPALAKAASAPFDRAAWQEDFSELRSGLERTYVNLAWMGSPQSGIDVPRLERRTRDALATAETDAEAEQALLDFIAGFHDGHLSSLPRVMVSSVAADPEPAAASLSARDAATGCAVLGYAATSPIAFTLPFESLPGFILIGDGLVEPFRTGLVPGPDGRMVGIVRIQKFEATAFPAVCGRAWEKLSAEKTTITPDAVEETADNIWFEALARTLASLREHGAAAVLVDVGNNGGGGDSGDWIPRMFTGRTVSSARMLMVDAQVSAKYFDEQISVMDEGLARHPQALGGQALHEARRFFEKRKAMLGVRRCDLSWVWNEQRLWRAEACNNLIDAGFAGGFRSDLPREAYRSPDVRRRLSWSASIEGQFGAWTGPVYVLTNGRTFSAAEMFAATMRDNGIAKTIGEHTGGDGCGFMAKGDPLVLSHSQLRFRVPNCLRLRADGTDEVAGIAPDIQLSPIRGESGRGRAARALSAITQNFR